MDTLQTFWDAFRAAQLERNLSTEPAEAFAFGDSPEMVDRLGKLVRGGTKTATTSALWSYKPDKALPKVGELSIVLNGEGKPLCVIETTGVRTTSFAKVDAEFAFARVKATVP